MRVSSEVVLNVLFLESRNVRHDLDTPHKQNVGCMISGPSRFFQSSMLWYCAISSFLDLARVEYNSYTSWCHSFQSHTNCTEGLLHASLPMILLFATSLQSVQKVFLQFCLDFIHTFLVELWINYSFVWMLFWKFCALLIYSLFGFMDNNCIWWTTGAGRKL